MVFLKENLIRCLEMVKPEGYDLEYHTGVISFKKSEENKIKSIDITFAHYFPHSITFNVITNSIFFNEIEDILDNKSKELGMPYSSASTFKFLPQSNFSKYSITDTSIESESQFLPIKPSIQHIIEKDCLTFFEEYQSLSKIADFLSELKPKEVVPYIQGAKLFSKTILILKQTKHPSFDQKRDEFYEVLKKQATKKDIYKQQLQLFETLFPVQSA